MPRRTNGQKRGLGIARIETFDRSGADTGGPQRRVPGPWRHVRVRIERPARFASSFEPVEIGGVVHELELRSGRVATLDRDDDFAETAVLDAPVDGVEPRGPLRMACARIVLSKGAVAPDKQHGVTVAQPRPGSTAV